VWQSKTGAPWSWTVRDTFEKKPGKYLLLRHDHSGFKVEGKLKSIPIDLSSVLPPPPLQSKEEKKMAMEAEEDPEKHVAVTAKEKSGLKEKSGSKGKKQAKQAKLDTVPPSALSPAVQGLMHQLSDVRMLTSSLRGFKLDSNALSLGRLAQSTLLQARAVLSEIKVGIQETGRLRAGAHTASGQYDAKLVLLHMNEQAVLSSRFYELLPHAEYNGQPIEPISTEEQVKQKMDTITRLLELEVASKLLLAANAPAQRSRFHPLDYILGSLDVMVEDVQRGSPEYAAIEQYMRTSTPLAESQATAQLQRLFRIQRKGEAEQIKRWKGVPNHLLLWHGTSNANILSILKQGLRIAPPEAPASGLMFGKGVYFADNFSKSLGYCGGGAFYQYVYRHAEASSSEPADADGNTATAATTSTVTQQVAFLLLAEVACGNMHQVKEAEYRESAADGSHSTMALGKHTPTFERDIVLDNGVCVPLSEVVSRPSPATDRFAWQWKSSARSWGGGERVPAEVNAKLEAALMAGEEGCQFEGVSGGVPFKFHLRFAELTNEATRQPCSPAIYNPARLSFRSEDKQALDGKLSGALHLKRGPEVMHTGAAAGDVVGEDVAPTWGTVDFEIRRALAPKVQAEVAPASGAPSTVSGSIAGNEDEDEDELAPDDSEALSVTIERVQTRQSFALHHNEYIVYDPSQIRLRYLVQVRLESEHPSSDGDASSGSDSDCDY
jgi:hypothetical protein